MYLADDVPEQRTRDAVKAAGSRMTSDLYKPQRYIKDDRSNPLEIVDTKPLLA